MSVTERVRAAADATVAAGTTRLTMRTHLPDAPPMDMVGVVDFSRRRSWARPTMPPTPDGEAAGPIEVETVIDGPDFYLEVLELPGRWLRTRLDAHDEQMPAGDPGLLFGLAARVHGPNASDRHLRQWGARGVRRRTGSRPGRRGRPVRDPSGGPDVDRSDRSRRHAPTGSGVARCGRTTPPARHPRPR